MNINSRNSTTPDPFDFLTSVPVDTGFRATSSPDASPVYKAAGMFGGITTAFTARFAATFKLLLGSSSKGDSSSKSTSPMQ